MLASSLSLHPKYILYFFKSMYSVCHLSYVKLYIIIYKYLKMKEILASTNLFFDHFKRLPYTGRNTSTLNCHQRQHSLINQLAPNCNEIKIYAYYKKSPRNNPAGRAPMQFSAKLSNGYWMVGQRCFID